MNILDEILFEFTAFEDVEDISIQMTILKLYNLIEQLRPLVELGEIFVENYYHDDILENFECSGFFHEDYCKIKDLIKQIKV